jgi:hypothetical protein
MLIDLRKDAPDQSTSIDPDKLSTEVEKLQSVKKQIENLESRIMEDMNLSSLKLKDGSELSVKKIYSASIRADKKAEAIHWLRENGLGDIVKNNITVSFGQNEDNKAVEYASLARSNGYEPIQEEKVHPSTLKVVMKEWNDKGHEVPEELFSTFDGNQTYFKNKK